MGKRLIGYLTAIVMLLSAMSVQAAESTALPETEPTALEAEPAVVETEATEDSVTLMASAVSSGTCGDSLTWTLDGEGTLTISGTGAMTNWGSPSDVPWDSSTSHVETVIIGDGVTSIGRNAFNYCSSLTSVTIPDSVMSIGDWAFDECNSLTNVTIPDSVTSIGSGAFYRCSSLTSVTIGDGVTSIDYRAFYNCNSLTNVTIPDSVTSIGREAFDSCSSLTSVTIGVSVTSIGYYAFSDCSSLKSVTIPDSVTSIGSGAFYECSSLTSVTIGYSVTSIGDCAFSDCSSLMSVIIPDSVTSIGGQAFYHCSKLTSVTIPDSVISIGSWAFTGCSSLTSVTIPDSVTSIDEATFAACYDLTSVTIPDSVTNIGSMAFENCSSLTSVIIPDSVTSIGGQAFYHCSKLTSVTIPDSVISIGSWAFSGCDSLAEVHYSGTISQWENVEIEFPSSNEALYSATIYCNDGVINRPEEPSTPSPSPTPPIHSPEEDNNFAGGEELIDKAGIDAENLLSNISVGTDTIRGPKVSILGYDFYLFEVDGSCSLKLGDIKIQLKVIPEKNAIQILGGYDFLDEELSTGSDYSGRGEWTKSYNELKSLYNALTGGKLDDKTARSKFSSVYNNLKNNDTNLFLNIKGNFALYGELTYNNEQWSLTEGGGILKASAGGSIDPRIGGIFYGTFGISVDASGNFAMRYDWDDSALAVNAKLTINPEINLGIGAGSKKASLFIEGGLKGELPIDIAVDTGSFDTGDSSIVPFKVTAKGYLYLKAKAVFFETENSCQLGDDIVLYPNDGEVTLQSIDDMFSLNAEDFKMIPRDYLGEVSLMSLSNTFEKSDVYPYNTPQLISLSDGRLMLLWIDDDPSKADADRTSMYYSIYSRSNDMWSEPQIAASVEGYNDLMQVCTDGEKVYVVWSGINESLGDIAEIEDVVSRMDLYYTLFDGQSFGDPQLISDSSNGLYEMLYAIGEDDGIVTVAWAENSSNDLLLSEGTNTIYKRTLSEGVWSDAEVIAEITGELHDVKISENGGVVYETRNGDATEIYLNGQKIGETQNSYSAMQVTDNKIYYLSNDTLHTYDTESGETTSEHIGEITNITVLEDDDRKIALTLQPTGFTNELYQNEYIDGKWGEWTQLTDYNKYIRDYVPVIDNDSLVMALNLVDVEDEETVDYRNAVLKVVNDVQYSDIIIDDAPYYEGDVKENGTIEICFNVTNNSRTDMSSLNVNITDASGNVMYNGNAECDIKAGQTQQLSVPVVIPEGFAKQDLTVTVMPGFDETDIENNTATVTVGYADISLENVSLIKDGNSVVINGTVRNIGFENAENVIMNIYDSSMNGEHLQAITIGQLSAGEDHNFEFTLPEQYLITSAAKRAVYVELSTDSVEVEFGNNSDRIVFSDMSDFEDISGVTMSYENGILTVKTPKAMGADFIVAYYADDGSLISCTIKELALGAGTNNILVDEINTGSNVKLTLWDGLDTMNPLVRTDGTGVDTGNESPQLPTPTPKLTPSPTPTASPTPTPTPTVSPTPTPTASPTPSPTASPTPTPVSVDEPSPSPTPTAETVASGECGDALTWTLDNEGTLIIIGTGEMYDYGSSSETPWYDFCNDIDNIIIEDGITSIGSRAFSGRKSLSLLVVEMPKSIAQIGDYAFYDNSSNTGIVEIYYQGSKTEWDNIAIGDGCGYLSNTIINYEEDKACGGICGDSVEWILDDEGTMIISGSGNMMSGNITMRLCSWWQTKRYDIKNIVINDGVSDIGDAAFYQLRNLISISIPDSVTSIGGYAFRECSSLTSMYMTSNITSVGVCAFQGCRNLTDIYYNGTADQWNNMDIESNNEYFTNASIHYEMGEIKLDDLIGDAPAVSDEYGELTTAVVKVQTNGITAVYGENFIAAYHGKLLTQADYASLINGYGELGISDVIDNLVFVVEPNTTVTASPAYQTEEDKESNIIVVVPGEGGEATYNGL